MKKPRDLVYGVDDAPPLAVTLLSGLQHVGIIAIILVYPLLLAREAGLAKERVFDFLSVSMLMLGLAAVLQALPRGPVGSRFLCPPVFTAAYLGPSLTALKLGGLPLVLGMTAFGGVIEAALSRALKSLRPYFPSEISGFVVTMIGIAVGSLGLRTVLGWGTASSGGARDLAVAAITIATMIALNVWTRGGPRLFCAFIGMVVGYLIAAGAGLIPAADVGVIHEAPLLRIPSLIHVGWSFDGGLAVPFAVAALATAIRTMGDVTICQKTNDAEWVRPDLRSLGGGVLANGLVNVAAGVVGTLGISTHTSSVGLAAATGVTSRRVAYAIGGIFVVLAFLPKASALFVIMPRPVMGAALLFSASFIFVSGLQIITSRILDVRRTFVIGLSFMLGLGVDLYPSAFAVVPAKLQPLVSSSLVLGTLTALALNVIFRLGVRRTQSLAIEPGRRFDPKQVEDFMEAQGATWGARRDVIDRASFNLTQSVEVILDSCEPDGALVIEASFDEFNLDVRVSYVGAPLALPEARPSNEEIAASEAGQRRLAGFMLRRYADRVDSTHRNGRTTILFHFDH
jgi:NCS2 family nucleobase:cation symporter-2